MSTATAFQPDVPPVSPLDQADLRVRVGAALTAFLSSREGLVRAVGDELVPVTRAVAEFVLDGGKRLRPAFCYWGYRGAGGGDCDAAVRAAASLELLHACALIHDDVMDDSDTRRGRPAVHRSFAALHRDHGWRGRPESFGTSAAILIGDLCLVWSDRMLATSGMPADALGRAGAVFDEMRTELMAGQYLDMLEQAAGGHSLDRSLRVARYKSAKYTIERPLHLGAALAGPRTSTGPVGGGAEGTAPAVRDAYSGYGLPLGEAFQLRDDVLGVFGDPVRTGKPAGDDLREGKRTALVALTLDRASPAQAELVRRHLGDPGLSEDGVEALRSVIVETGALAETERLIGLLTGQALASLDTPVITDEARDVLRTLAVAATSRAR